MKIRRFIFFALMILSGDFLSAKVRLPALVSDGMVLQRDQKITIWGKADAEEKISVTFLNKKYTAITDNNGDWKINLPKIKSGGPYAMTINEITLKDIMIGDVWLASGQSNMELPMRRVKPIYEEEIRNANHPNIRFFTVPQRYNFKSAQSDFDSGKWESANQQTIVNFSAVAYFFAKELNLKNKVAIGIINASLGGSPIQAWMDENSLKKYPEYLTEADKWKSDELIKSTEAADQKLSKEWYAKLDQTDTGLAQNWKGFSLNDSDWKTMNVPGSWEDNEGAFDGSVWLRKEINLTKNQAGRLAFLNLGRIKDADETYINGLKVGNVTYEYPPRWYDVPKGVLKEGRNVIAVRITNGSGRGGLIADKPYYLEIDGEKIELTGVWKYKIGAKMEKMAPGQTFIRWKPTGLYNAMVNPLINYKIKGFVWYQGESNVGKPQEYGDLLSTMIADWRIKWGNAQLPFIVVQLANFLEAKNQPMESQWAELRDQQRKVSVNVPNTALAVTIDVGEWNDIHPLNKKTVGDRLALQALKFEDNNLTADGPVYESMKIEGNKIVLSFKKGTADFLNVAELKGFAIRAKSGSYKWANATISGNRILVWNDGVKDPIAVRYDWADNPEGNLRNKNNLPASPFTTE